MSAAVAGAGLVGVALIIAVYLGKMINSTTKLAEKLIK